MVSIAPPSGAGCIKGLAFKEFLTWYAGAHGNTDIVRALRRLPAAQRDLFDLAHPAFGVLSSTWYPVEMVHRVLDQICIARSDQQIEELAREAAVPVMNRMMSGPYAFAFSTIFSPLRWVYLRQQIWDLYYDTGELHSELLGEDGVRTWFDGWSGHHRLACKLTRASNLAIYAAMGLKNVTVELTQCVDFGHDQCEVMIHWGAAAQ